MSLGGWSRDDPPEPIELEARRWLEAIERETGHLEVLRRLEIAEAHDGLPPPGRRFPRSIRFLILALGVARTPDVALPEALGPGLSDSP